MSSTYADSYATCIQDSLDSSGHWRVQVGDTEALEAVLSHVWSLSRSDVDDLTVEVLTLDETVKNLDASVPLRLKTSELTSANIVQIRKTAAEGRQLPSVIVSPDTAVSILPAEGVIYWVAGAKPRALARGYAPSLTDTTHRLQQFWIFRDI